MAVNTGTRLLNQERAVKADNPAALSASVQVLGEQSIKAEMRAASLLDLCHGLAGFGVGSSGSQLVSPITRIELDATQAPCYRLQIILGMGAATIECGPNQSGGWVVAWDERRQLAAYYNCAKKELVLACRRLRGTKLGQLRDCNLVLPLRFGSAGRWVELRGVGKGYAQQTYWHGLVGQPVVVNINLHHPDGDDRAKPQAAVATSLNAWGWGQLQARLGMSSGHSIIGGRR